MALSGSSYAAVGSYWRVVLEWTATQNTTSNYSDVTAKLYWQDTGSNSGVISSASKTGKIVIDGSTTTFSGSGLAGLSPNQKKLLKTVTKRVYHNTDGTKSISISGTFDMAVTLSGTYYASKTASLTASLNNIPRVSKISTLANFTIGTAPAITFEVASSGLKYDINATMNGKTMQSWTNVTTLPSTLNFSTGAQDLMYAELKNATSGTLRVTLITYSSGGTRMGTFYKDTTASVGSSIVPVISTVTIAEAVAGLNAQFAGYVQNKSKLSVSVAASGAKSSTIQSYKIVANGATYSTSSFTTAVLKSSGTNVISIEVTDSRGRKATTTRSVTVLAYTPPSVTKIDAIRSDAAGTAQDDGAYAKVTYVGAVSSVNNKNTKTFRILHKEASATTWTTTTLTVSGYAANGSVIIPNINPDLQYDFKFQAVDYFTTVELSTTIGTAFTLLNFHPSGKGMAIGGVMQRTEGVDFLIDVDFAETPTVGNALLIESGTNANGYWVKHADGTLWCTTGSFFLSTITGSGAAARIEGLWTLPTSFVGTPVVMANLIGYANGTPETITHLRTKKASSSSYVVTASKNSGSTATAFTTGDTIEVSLMAIGRWK